MGSRCSNHEFLYSSLHHLRRFYARVIADEDWVPSPTPEGEDPSEDNILEEESDNMDSHLFRVAGYSSLAASDFPVGFLAPFCLRRVSSNICCLIPSISLIASAGWMWKLL